MPTKMISRMAPSNTGVPTLGNARTLFIAHLTALQNNGDTILRIESTDAKRSTDDSTKAIYDTLDFLGISYNPLVIDQATQQASGVYEDIARKLIEKGFAYYCSCSTQDLQNMKRIQIETKSGRIGYDGTCRHKANTCGTVRFNAEATAKAFAMLDVQFEDGTFGYRRTNFRDIQDAVLLRADGTATYMLSNVADDVLSGTTHIVRGVDLIPQTAMQILLTKAIKHAISSDKNPEHFSYTHLPLIVDKDGQKLSKRNPTTKTVIDYKAEGYLTDAVCQYICSLGNTSVTLGKPLSRQQLVEAYNPKSTSQSNVKMCESNLKALNKLHIMALTAEQLQGKLKEYCGVTYSLALVELHKTRGSTLKELVDSIEFLLDKLGKTKVQIETTKQLLSTLTGFKEFRTKALEGRPTAPIDQIMDALIHSEFMEVA